MEAEWSSINSTDSSRRSVYIKDVSHLSSQLGIFVFTFTVKRFHIYGALLHLALKVSTFTGPYYIFTYRGATRGYSYVWQS